MYKPISDYAMISNGRCAALIASDGSMDWLCVPEPHSPAFFWSLLDHERGGRWTIKPRALRTVSRRYLPETLALETTFDCEHGQLTLLDQFQVKPPDARPGSMHPDHEITRRLECTRGTVQVDVRFAPRPDFGKRRHRLHNCPPHGLSLDAGSYSALLASDLPLELRGPDAAASAALSTGQVRWIALSLTEYGPQVWPMIGKEGQRRTRATDDWWRQWGESCDLPDEHADAVLRSALTLKALSYPPTGAVLAAPTTSLPEELGGARNWDYRYCWIRDASFVMRAMLGLGVHDDAKAFFGWLLNTTRLTRPHLRVLYDVFGRRCPRERRLDHVEGYKRSRPVRTGNAAQDQLQLDTYGALLDAAWLYHRSEESLSRSAGRMLRGFVNVARDSWRQPDHGIWEIRTDRRHHTVSKAMCWVAMDRGLRLARDGVMDLDEDSIEREMEHAREGITSRGFSADLDSYTATLDGDAVDASLLLLSIYGFESPDSPRMVATIDRVYEYLAADGALFRYRDVDDGVAGREGGRFGICGFWGVEALAQAGRIDEAQAAFESLMQHANDVGLFAEEIEVSDGRALGNFPQALTHVGVINAARALARARNSNTPQASSSADAPDAGPGLHPTEER